MSINIQNTFLYREFILPCIGLKVITVMIYETEMNYADRNAYSITQEKVNLYRPEIPYTIQAYLFSQRQIL